MLTVVERAYTSSIWYRRRRSGSRVGSAGLQNGLCAALASLVERIVVMCCLPATSAAIVKATVIDRTARP
jgi:hypothetical protein